MEIFVHISYLLLIHLKNCIIKNTLNLINDEFLYLSL